jgi:hypothetical protein
MDDKVLLPFKEDDFGNDQRFKVNMGHARLAESVPKLPDGSFSAVINVEVYGMPDTSDPELAGKSFMLMEDDRPISDHFTRGSRRLCGNVTSMTPGIAYVQSYRTLGWLNNVLRVSSAGGPMGYDEFNQRLKGILHLDAAPSPLSASDTSFRVICHVWIDWDSKEPIDPQQVIRRTDAMIDRDDILQVVVTNNEYQNFPVMPNAYNVIAVGRVVNESSVGPTLLDGPGRAKPDILAPLHTTSQATPSVSSAVVLLLE